MGADIHMYVEKKKDGKWKGVLGPDPYADLKKDDHIEWIETWIYGGRNYYLFSFLADVRNDGDIKPIAEPKGLPEDVTSFVKKDSDRWGVDGHSHTYFYVDELLKIGKQKWKKIDETFYEQVISKLEMLEGNEKDSVRLVFWFDN